MISIILTAFKEQKTISKALSTLIDPKLSGYDGQIQLIQVSPDEATLEAGKKFTEIVDNEKLKFLQIKDPGISKPYALNMALDKVENDIVILTDGDVAFENNSLNILIGEFKRKNFDIACGQVVSTNNRNKFMGYISHLMTAAADDKRVKTLLSREPEFFPLSGYILILNKKAYENKTSKKLEVPQDCLVEDAYISYIYYNNDLRLGYIPQAKVEVKFPSTLSDYFKQKKRSTGGYIQLWKYNIVKKETNSRSFNEELKYFMFPINFAKNFKEILWSLIFYPIRFYLWLLMWLERKIFNKNFEKTWVRIESTK